MSANLKSNRRRPCRAFTMIEVLAVIAIMGIIAAMVLNLGKLGSQKRTLSRVEAQKNRLILMINSYYAKLNYYPPDNPLLPNVTNSPKYYDAYAATNALLYELTGGTNVGGGASIAVFNDGKNNTNIPVASFTTVFGSLRGGIANSDPLEPHNFYNPGPAPADYTNYATITGTPIYGLTVPATPATGKFNFWHFDSSTGNRHNLNSYDLWAEFVIGSKNGVPIIITNGNW